MRTPKNKRRGGQLMIGAALAFFVAGIMGEQPAFYGVAAAFLAIGMTAIRKAPKP